MIKLLGILLATLGTAAAAAPLWQTTQTGMSATEVVKLFPDAARPAKIDTLKGGAGCDLALSSYRVGGDDYQVCFFFLSGKLMQVTLSAKTPSEAQFNSIADLLRSKYGPELGAGHPFCERGFMTKCSADWTREGGGNISLLFLQVGQSDPGVLNVNYQARMANDAAKL